MTQAPADQVQAYAMKYDKILGDRQNIMFVDSETNKVYGVKTPKPGVAMLRKQGNQIIPEDQ